MNIVLWVLQGLLALAFIMAGLMHAFRAEQMQKQPRMGWIAAVPKPLMTFIGLAEMAGSVGLLLPALTGILPWLTPLAAAGLALVMLFAIIFHIPRKEYSSTVFNFILLVLAAFVAYGRWVLAPL